MREESVGTGLACQLDGDEQKAAGAQFTLRGGLEGHARPR
jgi:hypothetical protein